MTTLLISDTTFSIYYFPYIIFHILFSIYYFPYIIFDFIEDLVYNENLVNTNLRKRTLKKLIKDTWSKTVFTANKKLYQQIDGVSVGSSLGLLLANITMAELEWKVTK